MPPLISSLTLRTLRTIIQRPSIAATAIKTTSCFQPILRTPAALAGFTTARLTIAPAGPSALLRRQFSTSPFRQATCNQVRRGCRVSQRARRSRSPALVDRSQMKGVCLKTGITKPKKPNSGERKTARVRLSSGKVITAYIPGEGMYFPFVGVGGREERRNRRLTGSRSQCPAAQCSSGSWWQSSGLSWCEISLSSWCYGFGMFSIYSLATIYRPVY